MTRWWPQTATSGAGQEEIGIELNFYKHHLGDYDAATAHLSWDEDQAYTRLLRVYYRTERPIPKDPATACRLVRAGSKAQRQAVATVLSEFFIELEDGWHNKRADEEIASYVVQRDKNRQNGPLGGRPRKTELVPPDNHDGSKMKPNHNPNHKPEPDTKNQNRGGFDSVDSLNQKLLEKNEEKRDVRSLIHETTAHLTRRKFG